VVMSDIGTLSRRLASLLAGACFAAKGPEDPTARQAGPCARPHAWLRAHVVPAEG
jgi:hypothetical protein